MALQHLPLASIGDVLRKEYNAQRVILFGSQARGDAGEYSDIDLLVAAPTNEKFYDRMATIRRLLRHVAHGLPIAPVVLTPAEITARVECGDQFITEILRTGIEI